MRSRGILTLAVGKPKHIEMAKSLARSLIIHDPNLKRGIITDSRDPELGDLFTYRIHVRSEYGNPLSQKMYLDRYTPFDETLFIANDSLAIHSLDAFWTAFQSVPFGVSGTRTLRSNDSDEHIHLPFILDRFHLTDIPRASGAMYYFTRSPESAAIFNTARDLSSHASELHFTNLADCPCKGSVGSADAAFYSVAMAIHGLSHTDMGNAVSSSVLDSTTHLELDIPKGICNLVQGGTCFTPDILHLASFAESHLYLRECSRLERLAHGHPELTRSEELQLISTTAVLWMRRKVICSWRRLQSFFSTSPSPRMDDIKLRGTVS